MQTVLPLSTIPAGVGYLHSFPADDGRALYTNVTDSPRLCEPGLREIESGVAPTELVIVEACTLLHDRFPGMDGLVAPAVLRQSG